MDALNRSCVRRFRCFVLLAMAQLANAGGAPSVEVLECCNEKFAVADVVSFARKVEREKGGRPFVAIVVSNGRTTDFLSAGSSEEPPAACRERAVALQRRLSHAFLFRTVSGYSVHHWDHKKAAYSRVVVSGRDLYDAEFKLGSRLALVTSMWDGLGEFIPHLRIVMRPSPDLDAALQATRDIMSGLRIRSATAVVRGDGYVWPGSCHPYSLPIQWRDDSIDDVLSPRSESMFCRVGIDAKQDGCVMLGMLKN